jgi:hypothetical protein
MLLCAWPEGKQTYQVAIVQLKHWDFVDWKAIAKKNLKNTQVAVSGWKADWRQIRHMQFRKNQPGCISFKTNWDDEFEVLKCRPNRRSSTCGVPRIHVNDTWSEEKRPPGLQRWSQRSSMASIKVCHVGRKSETDCQCQICWKMTRTHPTLISVCFTGCVLAIVCSCV